MRVGVRGRGEHSLVVPTSLAADAVARSTTARPLAAALVVLLVWATATLEQAEDARRAGPPLATILRGLAAAAAAGRAVARPAPAVSPLDATGRIADEDDVFIVYRCTRGAAHDRASDEAMVSLFWFRGGGKPNQRNSTQREVRTLCA